MSLEGYVYLKMYHASEIIFAGQYNNLAGKCFYFYKIAPKTLRSMAVMIRLSFDPLGPRRKLVSKVEDWPLPQ